MYADCGIVKYRIIVQTINIILYHDETCVIYTSNI